MERYLIVGLGNYGEKYENTRHNAGFMYLSSLNIGKFRERDNYLFSDNIFGEFGGKNVTFMKPLTYMNLSGEAVKKFVDYCQIPISNICVIFDDIYLPVGKTRFKLHGGSGGHNGIKNIISEIGTEDFKRIKIGVGDKPEGWDLDDWVVSKFSADDIKLIKESFAEVSNLLKEHVLGFSL